MTQQVLGFFDGKPVHSISAKLIGQPDQVITKSSMDDKVAFIVLGQIEDVNHERDKDRRVVRVQKINMDTIRSISYEDAVMLVHDLDQKDREAQGVYELPFDESVE